MKPPKKCPKCNSRQIQKYGKTTYTLATGETKTGSQRYFCLQCKKSFTGTKPGRVGEGLSRREINQRYLASLRNAACDSDHIR